MVDEIERESDRQIVQWMAAITLSNWLSDCGKPEPHYEVLRSAPLRTVGWADVIM